MGVQIAELLEKREIEIKQLRNKTLAIDASNHLYQFLTTIRQPDGSLFTNSKGDVTSHLIGLFSRTTTLLKQGLKLVYVFDGIPPELKKAETQKRAETKQNAQRKYEAAEERGEVAEMRKYAARTARLNQKMTEQAKKLLTCLGVPFIQAPSEGEAQASHLVKNRDCYAVSSQDADCLLFESPALIRNLSITGRKKSINKAAYQHVSPELILLKENLAKLGISQEQLITLAILVGTDYNPGGVKGIGPKKALNLVKQHKTAEVVFSEVRWEFGMQWQEILSLIQNMPVTEDYSIEFGRLDTEEVKRFLVVENDFSPERVEKATAELAQTGKGKQQASLADFN